MTTPPATEHSTKRPSWLPAIVTAGWVAALVWLAVSIFSEDQAPEIGYVGTYLFFAFLYSAYYFAAVGVGWVICWCYRDSKRWRRENEA